MEQERHQPLPDRLLLTLAAAGEAVGPEPVEATALEVLEAVVLAAG